MLEDQLVPVEMAIQMMGVLQWEMAVQMEEVVPVEREVSMEVTVLMEVEIPLAMAVPMEMVTTEENYAVVREEKERRDVAGDFQKKLGRSKLRRPLSWFET